MPVAHPVIVGVGQITCHPEERVDSPHSLQLAKIAVEAGVEDCGARAILSQADCVTVINMFSHSYGDPAGIFCEMLGVQPRVREYTAIGGNTPQWLVNRTADRIARGEISIAILAGAEAMHNAPAQTRDNWLQNRDGSAGPEMVGDARWGSTPHEMLHYARYPLYENALRADRGMSIEENFLSALGWYFTKYSAGIYSGQEPGRPWDRKGHATMQKRLDAGQGPPLNMGPKGMASVEAYTVMHEREGKPEFAIIVARLRNGERCWAMTGKDPDLFRAMEKEEFVGKTGQVAPGDGAPNIMKF